MTDHTEATAEEENEFLFQHFRAFGTESLGLKAVVEHLGCLLILFCLCHFFKDSPFFNAVAHFQTSHRKTCSMSVSALQCA